MADTYERNLPSKSTLTTSDYIRVVGSDNASYKQLLSNVMTTAGLGELISSSGGWFNATAQTAFENAYSSWADNSIHIGVLSAGSVASFIAYRTSANYGAVQFLSYGANSTDPVDIRLKEIYNGTWGSLTRTPTRAEVDALKNKASLTFGIPATGSTFTVPNNYRGRLTIVTSSSANCGEYLLFATGAGAVETTAVKSATGVTLSTATNSLTITPASGTRDVLFETISPTPVTKQ